MSAAVRLLAFAALLVLVAGGAALAGRAVPPVHDGPPTGPAHGAHDDAGTAPMATHHDEGTDTMATTTHAPAGLTLTAGGHTLAPAATTLTPARPAEYRFRVLGPQGAAVRDYDLEHERRMHLIIARRDLHGFHHLHPRMAGGGTWSVTLPPLAAGAHRVFADFAVAGAGHTLGADLLVGDETPPRPLPAPAAEARTGPYRVALDAPAPAAGGAAEWTFRVRHDDALLGDLQPYLGARGHLVALREGDLAFLHVHPDDAAAGPGEVVFRAEPPSAGRYRLFLQFRHDGRVHTVAHTLVVPR